MGRIGLGPGDIHEPQIALAMTSSSSKNDLWIIGGIAVAVFVLFPKMIGKALVSVPSEFAAGVITQAAKIFGVPETNVSEGQAAFAAGDYFKASQLLPASQFISAMLTVQAPVKNTADLTTWFAAQGIDVNTDPAAVDIFSTWAANQDAIAAQQAQIDASLAAGWAAGG